MKSEPNEKLMQKQLDQLRAMVDELTDFIECVENDEVRLLEGRMTREINTGRHDEMPINELWITIEYLPRKKPPDLSDEIDVCAQMANRERK
jgi:hypothetical protein